jgi:hypothetical protein
MSLFLLGFLLDGRPRTSRRRARETDSLIDGQRSQKFRVEIDL